jgi:hypothetical protein
MWRPRAICQRLNTKFIALLPLVALLSADAEAFAELQEALLCFEHCSHKLYPLVHR